MSLEEKLEMKCLGPYEPKNFEMQQKNEKNASNGCSNLRHFSERI